MQARGGKRVLIATGTGSNWTCSSLESALGVALTLRGAEVRFLLCDGVLPACQECDHQWLSEPDFERYGPQRHLCSTCYEPARAMLAPLGLPILTYGQFLDSTPPSPPPASLAEHAHAGALRYYGRGTLPETQAARRIAQRYEAAGERTVAALRGLLKQQQPDVALFHHGIYIPQGVVGAVLREAGCRVVNWGLAYRKGTVLVSHDDSYHYTMIDESPSNWEDMAWSAEHEQTLLSYLRSRWTGGNDWINFQQDAEIDRATIVSALDLDPGRPVIGLLTNVIWDAQLHFRQSAFPSMLEWLFETIQYFITRPQFQLVIRVHPAEILGTVPSRQPAADEIAARFGDLPPHIKIVGPEAKVSTYALMEACDCALVYGTKTGLELACMGMQVVVAGEAWSRGKGFTCDVSTRDEYFSLLGQLPLGSRLQPDRVLAARKYAYHFFFRRMIPLAFLKPAKRFGPYRLAIDSLDELLPGRDPGLDIFCDGVLNGGAFVFS